MTKTQQVQFHPATKVRVAVGSPMKGLFARTGFPNTRASPGNSIPSGATCQEYPDGRTQSFWAHRGPQNDATIYQIFPKWQMDAPIPIDCESHNYINIYQHLTIYIYITRWILYGTRMY